MVGSSNRSARSTLKNTPTDTASNNWLRLVFGGKSLECHLSLPKILNSSHPSLMKNSLVYYCLALVCCIAFQAAAGPWDWTDFLGRSATTMLLMAAWHRWGWPRMSQFRST